jgi:hypothetical protein
LSTEDGLRVLSLEILALVSLKRLNVLLGILVQERSSVERLRLSLDLWEECSKLAERIGPLLGESSRSTIDVLSSSTSYPDYLLKTLERCPTCGHPEWPE